MTYAVRWSRPLLMVNSVVIPVVLLSAITVPAPVPVAEPPVPYHWTCR